MADFEIQDHVLVEYQGEETHVVIPDGVRVIGEDAFMRCSIESVIIPNGVRSIRSGAFMDCRRLRTLELPESVKTIGESAFSGSGLQSIRLPGGLQRIAEYCFYGASLTEITVPNSVRTIDSHAFARCGHLEKVVLPDGLRNIESGAFENCTRLRSIRLPPQTSVSGGAFDFCNAFAEADGFVVVNGMLFKSPAFSASYEVVIPDRVRVIKSFSVDIRRDVDGVMWYSNRQERWDAIEKKVGSVIHIPSSVEEIESDAFCGDILRIISASTAPFDPLALDGCPQLESLTVPAGTEVSENVFGYYEEDEERRRRLSVHYTGGEKE